ncbi:MAG TPA: DUF190 domain-containing protein, partial [Bacteroidales bacterium]|nr:DUF190 domain-containing protein [Bacteroidales bacterium]
MNPIPEAKVMRIYMSNTDMFKYSLLYETIVFAAKRYGLSGATVIKGVMGFGSSSIVNSIHFWEFNEKLPVVVEIIDTPAKIDSFAQKIEPWFNKIRYGCLITI